jgi:xanthine dehydrogenase YagS FAD-binding subunit
MTVELPPRHPTREYAAARAIGPVTFRAGGTAPSPATAALPTGSPAAIVDLTGIPELTGIHGNTAGTVRIGAMTTVAALATDPRLLTGYPALSATAAGLATPQIRATGTVGGNLRQHTRCWYLRDSRYRCFRNGVASCPARDGDHSRHSCFDLGPCVAPHPSSLGAALLTYDATVEVASRETLGIAEFFGDGSDPRRGDSLDEGELIIAVGLPAAIPGERGGYLRATSRSDGEWPLVEAVARLVVDPDSGLISVARVAVGGVAAIPLRLTAVEQLLVDRYPDDTTLHAAARVAGHGATPLPGTGYKLEMLRGVVLSVVEQVTR